jgi:hypothetical protein
MSALELTDESIDEFLGSIDTHVDARTPMEGP